MVMIFPGFKQTGARINLEHPGWRPTGNLDSLLILHLTASSLMVFAVRARRRNRFGGHRRPTRGMSSYFHSECAYSPLQKGSERLSDN